MYGEILIPTDGSRGSLAAVDHGISVAKRYGAVVRVLYAVDRNNGRIEEGKRVTEAVANSIRSSYTEASVSRRVAFGPPADVILREISESGIDIVVMGTHGRSGVARYLLGSVTAAVVRSSPVPVFTVHLSERTRTEYTDILVVTDGTGRTRSAATHGIDIADRYNALVHVVCVDSEADTTASARETADRSETRALRDVTDRAATRGVPTVESTIEGDPHNAVVEYANEHGVDVIVQSLVDRAAPGHVTSESLGECIIRAASTPVLTVCSTDRSRR